jgi:hypothetical protein
LESGKAAGIRAGDRCAAGTCARIVNVDSNDGRGAKVINDPYLTLELHRARVESVTADIRGGRLLRALRRHASSTDATESAPARRALRRRPA